MNCAGHIQRACASGSVPEGEIHRSNSAKQADEVKLEGHAAQMLAVLRGLLVVIQEKLEDFEHLVDEAAARHSVAERLRSIPGIGPFLSLSLAAFPALQPCLAFRRLQIRAPCP
jgi:transposase